MPAPSYVTVPGVRLGQVEAAYVPYVRPADDEQPVGTVPGIVELPVYGRDTGELRGLVLWVDYDQQFFRFESFRSVSDAWIREQVTRDNVNGSQVKFTFRRYSGRGNEPAGEEFLIGYIQFSLNALDAADRPTSPHESLFRLSAPEEAGSYYYTLSGDGSELRVNTALADGSISIYFHDGAELGSGLVSPVAQDVALPLYLTVLDPGDEPLQLTVDYDQGFLRLNNVRPVVPVVFRGEIVEETESAGGVGTVVTMTRNPEGTGGPLLRKHVADLIFSYTGVDPAEGHVDVSVQLVTADSGSTEPKDKAGARERIVAQLRVGSPYFIRGNISSRYSDLRDGTRLYGEPSLIDAQLIFQYLMAGQYLPCEVAADVNASGGIDMTDAIMLVGYLFNSGPPPSGPYPEPGWLSDYDQDAELGCGRSLPYYASTK